MKIAQGKHYETKFTMESLQHLHTSPKMLQRIRTVKLRRLDEYKHAFIQFLTKRLSLSRRSPRISSHKMELNSKDANMIINSLHKKVDFNIPVIYHDAIKYENKLDGYTISKYSRMSRCVWLGTKVTVRKMLSDTANKDNLSTLKAEVHVLGQIRHPCILLLLATSYDDKNNLMLLYENVEHGSLYVYLHNELRNPSEDFVLSILDQMAQVFIFLHQSKWIHTNLTSHAIQVMSFHRVKLSCFELAAHPDYKTETNPQSNKIRTHLYHWQAPEYYSGMSLGEYTDIYQYGLLTWELCQRQIPWSGLSLREIKEKYQMDKQAIGFTRTNASHQLMSIMDQSLNINPEERRLNFESALKLLSSAKSSLDELQTRTPKVPVSKETNIKCNTPPIQDGPIADETKLNKADVNSRSQSSINHIPKKPDKLIAQNFSENIQDTIDSFTGLRRVSESNFKTFYAWSMKESQGYQSFSRNYKSKSCHSSEKLINGAMDTKDSTKCQQNKTPKNVYFRSISASNNLNSMTSLMTPLPLKSGITSSSRIKPASHSLEKQLSSSSSLEFSWSCGSSTPYRASAIKPASHQSERGFPRSVKKIALDQEKSAILNNNCSNGVPNFNHVAKKNQSFSARIDPSVPFHWNKGKVLNGEYKHNPREPNQILGGFSMKRDYPSLSKETGEKSEEININPENSKAWLQKYNRLPSNHEKNMMPNLLYDNEPEVITKICEQLLIMINDPQTIKKETESLDRKLCSTEKHESRTKPQISKDCSLQLPIINDACVNKLEKPLTVTKRPSSKLLKILGLNLMEFYQDDELGPSLWNDENMQLGMYQHLGNSLETLASTEDFCSEQHNEIILWSEEEEVESDPEVKSKCQFNALYYTLSQKLEEDSSIRKEDQKIFPEDT
ncbi:mitogen-activated protein kinase kinase kinase A-like [Ischnura elegans]|uniref:mitogen-activated protein kinase kinase kinase A-like n=1 Tax=Ischnura elegans TaxID=197161 RepID=UPI001ED8959D|nr:mitogen-activated protein kinase kinase kinase A-like [Ischnura elegans]